MQSSWVILCQLGALLQASPVQKWPGGHTWSRDASKKHNKESKEASGASDSGTRQHTWSPPASIWGPPASISSAKEGQKQPGGHTWSPPASVSSEKEGQKQPGGHTWSPPASISSAKLMGLIRVILCQLGALLQVPVSPQHACMLAILHNPNPARPVECWWQSPSPATRRPAPAPGNAAREPWNLPWNTSLLHRVLF